MNIVVWCADIGSVKNKRFGWCRGDKDDFVGGTGINELCMELQRILIMVRKLPLDLNAHCLYP